MIVVGPPNNFNGPSLHKNTKGDTKGVTFTKYLNTDSCFFCRVLCEILLFSNWSCIHGFSLFCILFELIFRFFIYRAVAWPKYAGRGGEAMPPEQVPGGNSSVNFGDN